MKKVLVNGKLFEGNHIHEPDAVVEVFFNLENLQIYSPKEVIVHTNSQNLNVYGEHITMLIKENSCNIDLFANYAKVTVEKNTSNVHIFGDYSEISILGNSCNLQIFGNHIQAQVEDNDSNLQIFGNYHKVEIKKGRAEVYGDYGKTIVHPGAEVTSLGDPQEIIQLPETP